MNRRRALAALAGVGLTGGSLWATDRGLLGGGTDDLPIRVETLDAPGSEAGSAPVPTPGRVTVVDLFATWCAPCDEQVDILDSVRGEYDGVSFLSVTNERPSESLTRAEIADWWAENDGAWTLGIDPESELMAAFGADGLPYVAIVDAAGAVQFEHGGLVDADTLRTELDAVTDA